MTMQFCECYLRMTETNLGRHQLVQVCQQERNDISHCFISVRRTAQFVAHIQRSRK